MNCSGSWQWRVRGLVVLAMVALYMVPALAQRSRKPMAKTEVLELLESGVSATRIDELVRAYGISFEVTPEVIIEFEDAGARDDLIATLREISPKREPAAPPPKKEEAASQPPAAPAPPILMIETMPPGAEVYVDEERVGKTSPEGKLKVSTLGPGEHRLRVSAPGHDDLSRTVELTSGQTNVVAVALAPQKAPAPEPATNPQSPAKAQAVPAGFPTGDNPMDAYKAILGGMTGADGGDPNFKRFYVTHDHGKALMGYGGGLCSGMLIIGKDHVQFSSNNENDAFDVPASEITELQIKSNHIRFKLKGKKYHLMTQDMGMFGGDSQGPGALRQAFESVGLKSAGK